MEVYVLNQKFESIALIDSFTSFIWTDRYNEYGDFELCLAPSIEILQYLAKDNYLWKADSEHLMIIEQIEIKSDPEEGDRLYVTGRSLESILTRRIIWEQKVYTGNFQNAVESMLNEAIINPAIEDRKIDNFVFQASEDESITALTIDAQYTGDNLYDVITTRLIDERIGYKIILNNENQFVFSLYKGLDRSYDQTDNPYVIFSSSFENIINSDYTESYIDMKNITLVAGEGEGSARKTATVGSASGLLRRELFTDARDLSSSTNSGNLSAAQYQEQLIQRGKESLAKNNKEVVGFEAEAETTRMFVYGKDFFMGDIVQISDDYGHDGKAYIKEIIFSQDDSSTSTFPTFEMIQDDETESEEE